MTGCYDGMAAYIVWLASPYSLSDSRLDEDEV